MCRSILLLALLPAWLLSAADFVTESARRIPVAATVDVLVVGGTTGGVAAAVSAARNRASVYLIAAEPYLGADLCAHNRLWYEESGKPESELARKLLAPDMAYEEITPGEAGSSRSLFPTAPYERPPMRPLHIKKTLDEALLDNGVQFLFSSYATEVLRDADGKLAGIVMANRAGRQAIIAKVVIDATERASLARMAGAEFSAYPEGETEFRRIVLSPKVRTGPGVTARKFGYAGIIEYRLRLSMRDASFASFARAEQVARDWTYTEEQLSETDTIWQIPPDHLKARSRPPASWPGAKQLDTGVFQPSDVDRLYVLSGCAGLPTEQAEKLLRPLSFLQTGTRIGEAAATEASGLEFPESPQVAVTQNKATVTGDVKEILAGVRPSARGLDTVASPARTVPVLGTYDVIVVGGGTGGAPAAIAAAREGAKTLVLEYMHSLGGVGTRGRVSGYYWGDRRGFTKSLPFEQSWNPIRKAEWYRRMLREAGGEIWHGVLGCGAVVDKNRVKGVVVATPESRGVVLAKVVIDATGNSDVAAPAGAQTMYTGAGEVAMQGAGLPRIRLGGRPSNTDFTIVDETDMMDTWHVMVYAKSKYEKAFDIGQLIQTRERRRIVGDSVMTILDQLNGRTYPDTIATAYSNFDSHGYTTDPYFLLAHPEKEGLPVHIPYRCLLPKGLDGILATGLGISVHRDAVPLVRMQADIQNQGFAAGTAAAMIAEADIATRELDIKALQKKLVARDVIPESALTDKDSMPFPASKIAEAVERAGSDPDAIAILMTQPETASPLLRKAWAAANDKEKLIYAHILAVLGDPTGLDTLIEYVDSQEWDEGWNFKAMSQFGSALSPIDSLIVAMGRTHDARALPSIFRKMESLDADTPFSHHRAVSLALELIGDPSASEPLTDLLKKPGIIGHTANTVVKARDRNGPDTLEEQDRAQSLRELGLGRALFRCGDNKTGLGRWILDQYTRDLRGHLARHARDVLESAPGKKEAK